MKCPFCNQEIEDGSTVCPICGQTLSAEAVPAEAEAEAPAETPAEAEAEAPAETPAEVEAEAPAETPAEAEAEAPAETPAEAEAEAPAETPAEAEAEAPAETPAEAEAEAPAETPAEAEAEAPAETPAEAPAAKKKSKKTLGIAAVIAAGVVVVAGAAVLMPKKSPKDMVIGAFKSIVAENQVNPMEEIFGFGGMNEKLNKESSEMNMELQIQDSSDETISQLATGKLGITSMNDKTNKKNSFTAGIGYADMNLVNLEFYMDDGQIVFAVPELSKKAFSVNYADDLEGQIAASPFFGKMLTEDGTDVTGLNEYLAKSNELASADKKLFDFKDLWTRYKEGSKAVDDLKAAMTVEKADKKNFTVNGSEQSCNGYQVEITKDALVQFATTSKDFFLADETLKKDFVEYSSLLMELRGTMSAMGEAMEDKTPEEMQQEAWKSTEEQMDTLISQLKEALGDVSMVVYVTKDGKMASFDYSTTVDTVGDTEGADAAADTLTKLSGTVTFAGGYNMMSNVIATLNIESPEGDTAVITFDKSGTYEAGKTLDGALTLSLEETLPDGPNVISLICDGGYAVESGEFNLSFEARDGEESVGTLTSKGLVQDLVKGESFEAYIESIRLTAAPQTDGEEYVDLSGFLKAGPLESTVAVPEGENMDLFAATEDDFKGVVTEVYGNLFGLLMGLEQ